MWELPGLRHHLPRQRLRRREQGRPAGLRELPPCCAQMALQADQSECSSSARRARPPPPAPHTHTHTHTHTPTNTNTTHTHTRTHTHTHTHTHTYIHSLPPKMSQLVGFGPVHSLASDESNSPFQT